MIDPPWFLVAKELGREFKGRQMEDIQVMLLWQQSIGTRRCKGLGKVLVEGGVH